MLLADLARQPDPPYVDAITWNERHDLLLSRSSTVHHANHSCDHAVTGTDWRQPELQRRYRGHWIPWLEHRTSAEQSTG
jgi:hypothetical protein